MGGGVTASATSGSDVVIPDVTTSYAITCTGDGGSATAMVTVTVGIPASHAPPGGGEPAHGHKKK
jgi:hypothetical protein